MSRPLRVLIVEDSEDDTALLLRELRRGNYEPTYERVDTPEALKAALDGQTWDIVFGDYSMPHFSTISALTLLKESGLDLPFIIVSDSLGEDTAVAAMKAGAHDYFIKGNLKRLIPAVERELREAGVRRDRMRTEEALRTSERRLAGALDIAEAAVISVDESQRIILFDRSAEKIFGYTAQEVLGQPLDLLLPSRFAEAHRQHLRDFSAGAVAARRMGERQEVFGRRKDGTEFPAEAAISKLDQAGQATLTAVLRDITERKVAEELLKAHVRQQAVVAELGQHALAGTELSILMNEAVALVAQTLEVEYCKILALLPDGNALLLQAGVGWKEGLVGQATVGTGESEAGYALLSKVPVIVEDLQTEIRFSEPLLHDHGVVSGMSVIIPGQDQPSGVLGAHATTRRIFTQDDVNFLQAVANVLAAAIKHRQSEETIRFLAYHDALTQLPNRTLFYDRLQQAILAANRENKTLALLILDLDRFKEVNDTMGHHIGDLLLKQVGSRLRDLLRESDTVARLGGDEFAIVLSNINHEGAILAAQKALSSLQAPYTLEGVSLESQVSIGIALFPEHGEDAATLIRHADVAMYMTKHVGHGYAVYSPEQHQQKPRHLALMRELRYAIERDELRVHYQPKIDLRTKRVIGAEALVRWQHPLGGLITPDQFIPLAERSGLIKPLTQWVLNTALRQCQGWHQAGKEISVALNLSAPILQDPELPDQIARLLQTCDVAPRWLELEITESMMMGDPTRALEVLARLNELGVGLSIDDFGTGYSSLDHLKKLPINQIKIAQPFVTGMMADENGTVLVLSIINLAHNLDLKVVAEGVENDETLNRLAAFGCDAAQGYWMAPPLAQAELTRWLSESPWGLEPADH